MTTDTNTTADTAAEVDQRPGDEYHPAMPLDRLVAHPDNVRTTLGDLTDLVRSIKNKGVIIPALALPADDNGEHWIVAGHRRHAAAVKADAAAMPVIVRDLTPVEVLDAMLTENDQRADMTLAEQVRAVGRYQVLAPGESPTKIGKRIGRTARWVKDRLAVATLPDPVVAMIGVDLTLAQGAALAPIIERGDAAVSQCVEDLARDWRWRENPADAVTQWADRVDVHATHDAVVAKLTDAGVTVFISSADAAAVKAKKLQGPWDSVGFDDAAAKAHRTEPCHAECVEVERWDNKISRTPWCTDPKRHRATKTLPAASGIVAPDKQPASADQRDRQTEKANRLAREQRLAAVTAALTKRIPKVASQRFAAMVLIDALDQEGRKQACALIGQPLTKEAAYGDAADTLAAYLADTGDATPLLMALAVGHLETRGTKSSELSAKTAWNDRDKERIAAYLAWLGHNTNHGKEATS